MTLILREGRSVTAPRILDIVEVTKPIASPIRNAYIDFSRMTASLVAVVTNGSARAGAWWATASTPTAAMARAA